MNKISLVTTLQLMKRDSETGLYNPVSADDIMCIALSGFEFKCTSDIIEFNWDVFYATAEGSEFIFQTGKAFNPSGCNYELSHNYDSMYEMAGIDRDDITAAYLATVSQINKFMVSIDDINGVTRTIGNIAENRSNCQYRVHIVDAKLVDVDTDVEYPIEQYVIDNYNSGLETEA